MNVTLLREPGAPMLRVGHRGAKGHAPENTFASYDLAVEMGAGAVELDVHLSRDGEVVVIHDHQVDRTSDGHGFVKEMTLAELKELDAGAWYGEKYRGQRIPTLREVLEWAKDRVPLAIEIKNGPIYYPGIAARTLRLLEEFGMLRQAILISFDHFVVRQAKILQPECATGILYAGRLVDAVGAAKAVGADALHPQWAYITPDLLEVAHTAGLAVSAWIANDVPTLQALDRMGVDSAGSDYPDLFAKM